MKDIVRFEGESFRLGFDEIVFWRDINAVEAESMDRLKKLAFMRKVDIIFNAEYLFRNDNLHFRNAGWTDVLLKKARENGIAVGFSVSDFLRCENSTERAQVLGRMMQNVRLCRKFKVAMVVASCARNKWETRNAQDLLAFARVLGMNGKEANNALSWKIIKE